MRKLEGLFGPRQPEPSLGMENGRPAEFAILDAVESLLGDALLANLDPQRPTNSADNQRFSREQLTRTFRLDTLRSIAQKRTSRIIENIGEDWKRITELNRNGKRTFGVRTESRLYRGDGQTGNETVVTYKSPGKDNQKEVVSLARTAGDTHTILILEEDTSLLIFRLGRTHMDDIQIPFDASGARIQKQNQ